MVNTTTNLTALRKSACTPNNIHVRHHSSYLFIASMVISELLDLTIIVFLILLGVVAIKIGISFDINKFLEQCQKLEKDRLHVLCDHAVFEIDDDNNI